MVQVTFSVPDDAALALHLAPESVANEVLLAAAMKLYELGRLSSGGAAHLAGVSKPFFLSKLAAHDIPTFQQSAAELREEVANA